MTHTILEAMAEQQIPITAVLDELRLTRVALRVPANQARVIERLEQKCPDWRAPGALQTAFPPTFTPEVPSAVPESAVLQRAVSAIRLDPVSGHALGKVQLPAGTLVVGAADALEQAYLEESTTVTVRVRYEDGLIGLKEISAAELRAAVNGAS